MLDPASLEDLEQVLLSGLAEGQPVEGQVVLEPSVPGGVGAQRIREDGPMDARRPRVHPVRCKFPKISTLVEAQLVGGVPWIDDSRGKNSGSMPVSDVAADGQTAIAIHSALALLEVHWVRRRVPVDDRAAPPVEVDPFLAHARSRQNPRPERAVECRTNLREPRRLVALAGGSIAKCESTGEGDAPTGSVWIER